MHMQGGTQQKESTRAGAMKACLPFMIWHVRGTSHPRVRAPGLLHREQSGLSVQVLLVLLLLKLLLLQDGSRVEQSGLIKYPVCHERASCDWRIDYTRDANRNALKQPARQKYILGKRAAMLMDPHAKGLACACPA